MLPEPVSSQIPRPIGGGWKGLGVVLVDGGSKIDGEQRQDSSFVSTKITSITFAGTPLHC